MNFHQKKLTDRRRKSARKDGEKRLAPFVSNWIETDLSSLSSENSVINDLNRLIRRGASRGRTLAAKAMQTKPGPSKCVGREEEHRIIWGIKTHRIDCAAGDVAFGSLKF